MTARLGRVGALFPGLALCGAVAIAGFGAQSLQELAAGRAFLDALVAAILIGMAVRTLWVPGPAWGRGIAFAAKTLLEIAVTLLGASLSLQLVLSVGAGLLVAIVAVVAVALATSYGIGRAIGLPWRVAALVACGNSICGNSAIAAVAPVIGASPQDVASSITFTAILGVVVVIGLPALVPILGLSETQYGIVAGLTVYAVPQVLAATAPVGPLSVQIGTFVKLVRVLLLGPLIAAVSLAARGETRGPQGGRIAFARLVPPFVMGFLALMALRSLGLLPSIIIEPISLATKALTILAMAALGLGVDLRVVAKAGGRITAAVVLSLAVLAGLAVAVVRFALPGP